LRRPLAVRPSIRAPPRFAQFLNLRLRGREPWAYAAGARATRLLDIQLGALEAEGRGRLEAVIEACRLRLRPILMTSFAFILGVLPLVVSTGSGSEMRQAVGVAVFFGMIGVTLFGLIFTPIFYVVVRNLVDSRRGKKSPVAT